MGDSKTGNLVLKATVAKVESDHVAQLIVWRINDDSRLEIWQQRTKEVQVIQ